MDLLAFRRLERVLRPTVLPGLSKNEYPDGHGVSLCGEPSSENPDECRRP